MMMMMAMRVLEGWKEYNETNSKTAVCVAPKGKSRAEQAGSY